MRIIVYLFPLVLNALWIHADAPNFDDYFTNRTLRIDYYQTGKHDEMAISLDRIYKEGPWAGNPNRLIDDLNFGNYYIKLFDPASNRLIYSRGFSTIFAEYQTTPEAKKGIRRTFHQTWLTPFPRRPVLLVLEERNSLNVLTPVYSTQIDPEDVEIIYEKPTEQDQIIELQRSGPPQHSVDLVFVGEGYTQQQKVKFQQDILRYRDELLQVEPFQSYRNRLNISGILRFSSDQCVDEPTRGKFRHTVVDASFNALGTPRYLLINNNRNLRDIASRVPYDSIIVIANCDRYGGGGIYNDYMIFTSDNHRSAATFLHELGHAFANLADEYYSSTVAYTEFYPPGIEPHEANITALLDPDAVKWKHLLTPGIEVPTYWGQDQIEELEARVKEIQDSAASSEGDLEPDDSYPEGLGKIDELKRQIQQIRDHYKELYRGKIGVFEGAGYTSSGLFRSEIHVGMFHQGEYGKVSEEAILKVIRHLTDLEN